MVREFELPDVGEGVAEGELLDWLVEPGDAVSEDQSVAEVETDKAVVEVPSPVDGTVRELRAEPGEVVPVGTVIVTFDVEGDEGDTAATGSDEAAPAEAESTAGTEQTTDADPSADDETAPTADDATTADGTVADDDTAAADSDATAGAETSDGAATGSETGVETPDGRVFAAPSVRRLARELGVEIERVGGPDGRVSEGDVRAAANGGGTPSGDTTAASDAATEATADERAGEEPTRAVERSADSEDRSDAPRQASSADRERTLAAPATRRLADEEGIDLDAVPESEERDGEAFVTPEAVREYAETQQRAQEADAATADSGSAAAEPAPAEGSAAERGEREERVPYRGMRRTIGQQMERSAFTAPHVTHHDTVDITELVSVREELRDDAAERGIDLTYMPFVLRACVAALREFPLVNATLDEETEEIVRKQYYNLGVATATDAGLMVPVIEDADGKGLLQLATEMNELVEKARERTISREEMEGGTFTITNVGALGGEYSTPIINHPEVAILALGAIEERPRVVDGEVVPRHVLPLSLSFDHRVLDGAVAARFTNAVGRYLERPARLLLDG